MSTRDGFPRMDWDTGFLSDPKFQHLRDLLPDPVQFGYAGFCYLRLAADAWRTCERSPITAVVRGIQPETLAALRTAELIEEDGRLWGDSFAKWVERAMNARQQAAQRKRRSREDGSPVTVTPYVSQGVTVTPRGLRTGRTGSVGRNEGGVGETRPNGDADPLETVQSWLSSRRASVDPNSKLLTILAQLVDRMGAPKVLASMERLGEGLTGRQYILGAQNDLERIPVPKSGDPEREAEERRAHEKRLAQTQALIRETRPDPHPCPTCSHPMVEVPNRAERWVCTNSYGHRPVAVPSHSADVGGAP